jgi:hypothetical protein
VGKIAAQPDASKPFMAILASETVDTVEKFTPLYPLACRCFGGRNCYIRTGEKKEEEKRPLD